MPTRTHASGGGLYPVTVWLEPDRVDGIPRGLYRYQPYSHSLHPRRGESVDLATLYASGSFDLDHAAGAILFEFDLDRAFLKYGDLCLMTVLIEIGNMTHSLELCGSAGGIGSCQVAGFDKGYAEAQLGLDGVNAHVLFTLRDPLRRRGSQFPGAVRGAGSSNAHPE